MINNSNSVNNIAKEKAKVISELKEKRDKQVNSLHRNYKNELKAKDDSFNRTFEKQKKMNSESKEGIINDYEVSISENNRKVQKNVDKTREEAHRDITELKESFDVEKLAMKKEFRSKLDRLSAAYESIITGKDNEFNVIKEEHDYAIKTAQIRNERRVQSLIKEYQAKLKKLG